MARSHKESNSSSSCLPIIVLLVSTKLQCQRCNYTIASCIANKLRNVVMLSNNGHYILSIVTSFTHYDMGKFFGR